MVLHQTKQTSNLVQTLSQTYIVCLVVFEQVKMRKEVTYHDEESN